MSRENRIVIVDCCGERFSKIVDYWLDELIVGEKIFLELYPGQGWFVYVRNIISKDHGANPFSLEVVFLELKDEDLFYCLCNCIGERGWFEKEGACDGLSRR